MLAWCLYTGGRVVRLVSRWYVSLWNVCLWDVGLLCWIGSLRWHSHGIGTRGGEFDVRGLGVGWLLVLRLVAGRVNRLCDGGDLDRSCEGGGFA